MFLGLVTISIIGEHVFHIVIPPNEAILFATDFEITKKLFLILLPPTIMRILAVASHRRA